MIEESLYPTKYKCYPFSDDDWRPITSQFHDPAFLFSVLRVKGRFLSKCNYFSSERAELLENAV